MVADNPDLPDIKQNLIVLLEDGENEWEFRFTVNFLLREEQYDNRPYEELVRQVKLFFAEEAEKHD